MYNKAFLGGLVLAVVSVVTPLLVKAIAPQTTPADLPSANMTTKPLSVEMRFTALPKYRITHWETPQRLYLDLDDTPMIGGVTQSVGSESLISRISFPPAKGQDKLRIQIDFKAPVRFKSRMDRSGQYANLVIELAAKTGTQAPSLPAAPPVRSADVPIQSTKAVSGNPAAGTEGPALSPAPTVSRVEPRERNKRHWIIAIDAGHGGKDTGALGPNGVQEKDVVLAIARILADFVRAEPDMKPVMVRSGDQFVDLRQRVTTARDARADLFISLHADAYINDQAKGSSVFTLSDHGATSEAARWLADRENAALVDGVKLNGGNQTLASVLLDLSQDATLDTSDRVAGKILQELKKGFHVHHQDIQKAGFVVLKSPDIPSILVETAFISNPDEEMNLSSTQHQTQIARAIFKGIRACFTRPRNGVPSSLKVAEAIGNARK